MKLRKLMTVGGVLLSLAAVVPVVAAAKDGGDDPPGDVRGGHGADDRSTTAAKTAAPQTTRRAATTRTLKGTVGPGFTISLKVNGKKVTSLKAGRYTFVIADKASVHNFEVERESGAKFEKELTDVSFVGTKTVTLTLKRGKWKYYCAPHESVMRGFFSVK